jgi:ribosomal protein S16
VGAVAGLVTRRQLLELGYDDVAIARARRRGEWVVVRRGVYAPGPLPEERSARLRLEAAAGTVALASGAVVSHEVAALLHGLPLLWPAREAAVTLPRPVRTPVRTGELRVHAAALPPWHLTTLDGVPVTTAARTVVDLARWLGLRPGVVTADAALRTGAATRSELIGVLGDCRGWPGLRTARRTVDFADGASESPLESICRVAFHQQGLPPPTLQAWIRDADWAARVDFLWERQRTVVEADGLAKYDEPAALRAEKLRQERLEELGYTVVRVTWMQVGASPELVADRIRRAFWRLTLPR